MDDGELGRLLPRTLDTARGAVVVRTASGTDLPAVERLHHRCSTDTVFRRYFSAVPAVSPTLQARLLQTRLALVAEVGAEVVGLGHLAEHDGQPVELALLVEDAWQRYGVGLALAEAALDVADLWGLDRLVTYSLATSTGVHALMRRLRSGALRPQFHQAEDAVVQTVLPLTGRTLRSLTA
jgi:GNAT superfamily N-acetyltransferase